RQWLLKLGMTMMIGALFGVLLPACYAWLTFGRATLDPESLNVILLLALLIITLSFWAATLSSSALRGVISALLALIGVTVSVKLSTWAVSLVTNLQNTGLSQRALLIFVGAIIATALTQSFVLFRHPQACRGVVLKCTVILASVAVVVSGYFIALRP